MEKELIIKLVYVLLSFAISAIPLNISVKLLGGKSSWIKAIVVNIIAGIVGFLIITNVKHFAGFLAFIALLFVYKVIFSIGLLRAFFAWLLQLVIIGVFWALSFVFLSVGATTLSSL